MKQLPVFDKYFTEEDAEFYYNLLTKQGLSPLVEPPKENFNAILGHHQQNLQYILRLPHDQFMKASAILEKEIRTAGLPHDYYLHEMNDTELYTILKDPGEWSRQDVLAAKVLLEQRGLKIDEQQLLADKEEVKQSAKHKRKISVPVLVLFYFIAPIGALMPLIIGMVIYNLKETDVDGHKDFVFSNTYRQHGLMISAIGLLSIAAWILYLKVL
jgi:hypothetical protein